MTPEFTPQMIVERLNAWTSQALEGEAGIFTPFPQAAALRNALIEERLFGGTEIQDGLDACLLEAIEQGDLTVSEFLVEQGASPTNGVPSAVEVAAECGHRDIVMWLLGKGCNLDHALQHAVFSDQTNLVEELLARCPDGSKAAGIALGWGNNAGTETLRVLVGAGADVTSCGTNALWGAAERGDEDAFAMLVGAWVGTGWTAAPLLAPAANAGSAEIVRMILDAQPVQDVRVMDEAIKVAVFQNASDVIEVLVSRGTSVRKCLEKVVELDRPFPLGTLSKCGLDLATLDPEWVRGWIGQASPRMVKALLAHGMPDGLAKVE